MPVYIRQLKIKSCLQFFLVFKKKLEDFKTISINYALQDEMKHWTPNVLEVLPRVDYVAIDSEVNKDLEDR